jgi:FMN reductase
MRVVAVCGSLRPASATREALTRVLEGAARAGADTAFVDIAGLPWCDGRDDAYGPEVEAFNAALRAADAVVIGSPEYHGSASGVLKNALDLVNPADLKGKLVGLVACARGDAGAMSTLNQLRQVARWVDAWVLPTQVSIPRATDSFADPVRRATLDAELVALGAELVRYGKLLAGAVAVAVGYVAGGGGVGGGVRIAEVRSPQ